MPGSGSGVLPQGGSLVPDAPLLVFDFWATPFSPLSQHPAQLPNVVPSLPAATESEPWQEKQRSELGHPRG